METSGVCLVCRLFLLPAPASFWCYICLSHVRALAGLSPLSPLLRAVQVSGPCDHGQWWQCHGQSMWHALLMCLKFVSLLPLARHAHIWWGTCMHRCSTKSCEWGSGQPDVRAQRKQRAAKLGSIKWRKLQQLAEERLHLCTFTNTNRSKRAQSTLITRNRL